MRKQLPEKKKSSKRVIEKSCFVNLESSQASKISLSEDD